MEPITREEMYLATAAGEYSGELPAPITRQEQYLKKIIEEIDGGGSVSPEQIDAAIEAYLNSHDADIVTEQELSDELSGYYNKTDIDNALDSKADSTDIPDVSDFVTTAALAEKQDALTAGDNISIETINGELTISATDTTYSDATQQTHGLMSTADKTKLDSITAAKIQAWDAAEQNVNADWTAESGDAQILNKPDLTVYALADDVTAALGGKVDKETNKSLMSADEHTKLNNIEVGAQVNTVTGVKGTNEAEYRTGNISISKDNVGLGNVDNTADADKPISTAAQTALDNKVDKITGKGLSEANFTDAEKTKLAGIATGAEANVQSDWNQGDDAADDYIRNKPANLVQDASYVHTDNNFTNAEKAKADGAIQSTEKGTANGVAELNANGKVPTSQLPAYVDDVLSYNSLSDFPATGEDGKIYIAKDTNLSYRWGSSEYVVISPSLALGSTSSTAYRGDWGAEDRAAIGTLSTLNTTEKSNLVGAINELKTDSDTKQRTLTFDSAPTSGSTNPVTSGGVYIALAGKAAASHTHPAMTGADSNTAGTAGLVPAPAAGDNGKFLRGDGTWVRSLTIDQVYPVGSIYMSVNSTSPSTLFGGTWEQLKNRFLLGVSEYFPVGAIGGEAEHLLSNDELPANMGSLRALGWVGTGDYVATTGVVTRLSASSTDRTLPAGSDVQSGTYLFSGGGKVHNNMPPYLAVYMWKRTA